MQPVAVSVWTCMVECACVCIYVCVRIMDVGADGRRRQTVRGGMLEDVKW